MLDKINRINMRVDVRRLIWTALGFSPDPHVLVYNEQDTYKVQSLPLSPKASPQKTMGRLGGLCPLSESQGVLTCDL